MSKFNLDVICFDCKADETLAPTYAAAEAAEHEAVTALVRDGKPANFPGLGLTVADEVFLAGRRALRRRHDNSHPNRDSE